MTRVTVSLPRPYQAVIADGLLVRAGAQLRSRLGERRHAFVITVPTVRRRWGSRLLASLHAAGWTAKLVSMPDGERYKQLATVEKLAGQLIKLGADRQSVLIAFGGGVAGDVAGLLASLYMRGLDFVQIPTTVLAQVDASVGGKTGVNLRAGKNLLGTFHQPRIVLIDPGVLSTLPERQFRSGLYESLKCGVIARPELFFRLERLGPRALRRDPAQLEWVIAESVRLKAEIVSADEREGGLRRVLNFGHTIGHALEAETAYRHFLHGEAIAWGMIAATHMAAALRHTDENAARRITRAILAWGDLPKVNVSSRNILRRLQADKKTQAGVVRFILPREIGRVETTDSVPDDVVLDAVNWLRQLSR